MDDYRAFSREENEGKAVDAKIGISTHSLFTWQVVGQPLPLHHIGNYSQKQLSHARLVSGFVRSHRLSLVRIIQKTV